MDSPVDLARDIIRNNRYLALATCDGATPWAAALAYAVDKDYNFYFYSAKNSRHAQHIDTNPTVSFTIYDTSLPSDEVDGVQILGQVSEVSRISRSFLEYVHDLYYKQSFPEERIRQRWMQPVSAFQGEMSLKRFYRIVPLEIYKLDLSTIEVDQRIEISIDELKQTPAK